MHHIPRAEDLPLIPTIWHAIRLRPSNVLGRNPATDLRGEARYKKILWPATF
jgi:Cu2+-containing amine oxidase